jgi:F-type H+-transporting ATPase subunit epsilon
MLIEIITPVKQLYKGEVKLVQLPGKKSSFELLKNHAHLISTLKKGTLRLIDNEGTEKTFEIKEGVIENKNNNIVILVTG